MPKVKKSSSVLVKEVKALKKKKTKTKTKTKPPMNSAINQASSMVGRALGTLVGQGDLGALAGSSLASYFGHGDYELKSNSLVTAAAAGAKFSSVGRGTRIAEREFIGNIVSGALSGGSTVFTNNIFIINPSESSTFPWLSNLAHLYDQWEPHGIVFEFITTSSDYNGTSQALGAVIMATDYDPYDSAYNSKQQMENSDYACSSKPSSNLIHGVECAISERPTKLLYTSVGNGAPLTSTSLGTFQFATQGCSVAGVTLGELWVSYDITFYKKQLEMPNTPIYCAVGTTTGGAGFITNPVVTESSQITVTQSPGPSSESVINFNNQEVAKYIIQYFNLLSQGAGDLVGVIETNCTNTYRYVKPLTGNYILTYTVTTTGPNATFRFGVQGAIASAYSVSIVEVPLDYTF